MSLQENLFTEIHTKLSWFRPYLSTVEKRLVWVKGRMARVPDLGSHVANKWIFDTAVFVVMSPRTLQIDLLDNKFVSDDLLPVEASLTVIARPRATAPALISIAVYYQEALTNLATFLASTLRAECQRRKADALPNSLDKIRQALLEAANTQKDDSVPFEVVSCHLTLGCATISVNAQQQRETELETALLRVRNTKDLQQLDQELAIEERRCAEKVARAAKEADSKAKIESARIESLRAMSSLCIEAKFMAAGENQQLAALMANVEQTRLGKDIVAFEAAMEKARGFIQAMAQTHGFHSGLGQVVNIAPNKL